MTNTRNLSARESIHPRHYGRVMAERLRQRTSAPVVWEPEDEPDEELSAWRILAIAGALLAAGWVLTVLAFIAFAR